MALPNLEKRTLTGGEIRAAGDMVVSGIAAAYGVQSKDLGGFVEMISPGAFAQSLKNGADVRALVNHAINSVLGRVKNGTLVLSDSAEGLRFRLQLNAESSAHRDVYAAVKRGDMSECSFAFAVEKGGDSFSSGGVNERGEKVPLRTLRNVRLMDISIVTDPAYGKGTSVAARSAAPHADYKAKPLTDKQRRAKADKIADEVRRDKAAEIQRRVAADAAAEKQAASDKELRRRMRQAANITDSGENN